MNLRARRGLCPPWLAIAVGFAITAHAETLLLQNATIHPVTGANIPAGDVLVQDGKIKGIFDSSAPTRAIYPADARKIELKGLHLYPGMIALNTTLGLVEIGAVRATHDDREVGEFVPEVKSWLAVNPESELIPVARANGIAFFEPVPQRETVAGQSGLMAVSGWTTEQMAFQPGLGMHVYWPDFNLDLTPRERGGRNRERARTPDVQDKERKEAVKALDDYFQEARAYARARESAKDAAAFPRVPSWEAMLPVVRGTMPVIVHADDAREIRGAVQWATTNRLKMILAESRDAWRVAGLLASNNIPVIYNHVFTQPVRDTDSYDVQFAAPGVLQKAGVKVSFGLSSYRESLVKNLPYDAAQAVAFGLPADEALKGITLYPAQLAGVAERIGSIEIGKDATLFVSDGDILDIRSHVKQMWVAGQEVSLQSRHSRLYEKYRGRPRTP